MEELIAENTARLNELSTDTKGVFKPFANIVQQNIFNTINFNNGVYTITVESAPIDADFILADVFLNNSGNDMWAVTFSRDKNSACVVASSDGRTPVSSLNGRTQTTSLIYDASEDGTNSFPRWGQYS